MSSLDLTSQSEINTRFNEIIKQGEDKSNEYKKTCKYGLDNSSSTKNIITNELIIKYFEALDGVSTNNLLGLIEQLLKLQLDTIIRPRIHDFLNAGENVSPLQRIVFGFPDIEELKKIEEILMVLKENLDRISIEYIENFFLMAMDYLNILLANTMGDVNILDNYSQIFLDLVQKCRKKSNTDNINDSIKCTAYLIFLSRNCVYFNKDIIQKDINSNQYKLSFERDETNNKVFEAMFGGNSAKFSIRNRMFLELFLCEKDEFSDSVQNLLNNSDIEETLKSVQPLIDGNLDSFLSNNGFKSNYDLIKFHIQTIYKFIIDYEDIHKIFDDSQLFEKFSSLKDECDKLEISEDKMKFFQYAFMKGGCIRDLINIIYCMDLAFHKEEKTSEFFHQTKEIIFEIIFKFLENNRFLISLLFNENKYEKLLLNSNLINPGKENIQFYLKLIQNVKKNKIKINYLTLLVHLTLIKVEGYQIKFVKQNERIMDIPDDKVFKAERKREESELKNIENLFETPEILTIYLKIFSNCLRTSSDKTFMAINQIISNNLFFISKVGQIDLINKSSDLKLVEFYKYFFKTLNYLDLNFFQNIKSIVKIDDVKTVLIGPFEENEKVSNYKNIKIRKEIMLFYSKYHFLTLYQFSENQLINTSLRVVKSDVLNVISKNLNFTKFFFEENEEDIKTSKQALSYLLKGICIPVYLSLWKILNYCRLSGNEQYSIYSLVFLFYESYNYILKYIINKKENNIEELNQIEETLKDYFIEDFDLEKIQQDLSESIEYFKNPNKNDDENQNNNEEKKAFSYLDVKLWIENFGLLLSKFKFYNEIYNYYKNKDEESSNNNTSNLTSTHTSIIIQRKQNLTPIERIEEFLKHYKETKLDNEKNLVLEYFEEGEENEDIASPLFQNIIKGYYVPIYISPFLPTNYKQEPEEIIRESDNSLSVGNAEEKEAQNEEEENSLLDDNEISVNEEDPDEIARQEKLNLFKINYFQYSNTLIIEVGQRLFLSNPKFWQDKIVESPSTAKTMLVPLLTYQIYYLMQSVIYSNSVILPYSRDNLKLLITSIDFLRLLCEDHNPLFQTMLIGNYIPHAKNQKFDFVKLIFDSSCEMTRIFTHVSKQKDTIESLGFMEQYESLIDLDEELNDFRIEIIQGTTQKNLSILGNNEFFAEYLETFSRFLELLESEEIFSSLCSNFVRFVNCFIEENFVYSEPDVSSITNGLPPIKLLTKGENAFIHLLKTFEVKLGIEEDNFDNNILKDKTEVDLKKLGVKCSKLRQYLYENYEELIENPYFKIAFQIFVNIKHLSESDHPKQSSYKQILEDLSSPQNDKAINSDLTLIGKEYYQFCSFLLMKNDVMFGLDFKRWHGLGSLYVKLIPLEIQQYSNILNTDKKKGEATNDKPNTPELDPFTGKQTIHKNKSISIHPGENDSKLMIKSLQKKKTVSEKYIETIRETVDSIKSKIEPSLLTIYYLRPKESVLINYNDVITFCNKADYKDYFKKLSGLLDYYYTLSNIVEMRKRYRNKKLLLKLSELDLNQYEIYILIASFVPNILLMLAAPGNFFDWFIFIYEIFELLAILAIVGNYLYFKYINLKYIIPKQEIKQESNGDNNDSTVIIQNNENDNNNDEEITYSDILIYLKEPEILPFLWTFTFGFLGLIWPSFLSFQLFILFTISSTMKSVLDAIQNRYKQFLSTGFLLIILILFYAAITLYFFNMNDDGTYLCQSYLECFLYLFNNGMRAGGLPFEMKIEEQPGFYTEFFYSWIFYFLIILIILNIVNGIIVDTFQEIRENNNTLYEEKKNTCFICQLNRTLFESNGISFDDHVRKEHNILYYFCYLFKLHKTDAHDLNSVDFQVYNSINNSKVNFFPIDRANGIEKENDEDD